MELESSVKSIESGQIDLSDPEEIRRWADDLNIAPSELRALVAKVGPGVNDILDVIMLGGR